MLTKSKQKVETGDKQNLFIK